MRTFNLLKHLSDRHEITLVTQRVADVTDAEIEALRQWTGELLVFPHPIAAFGGILAKGKRFARFLLQGTPPNVMTLYSREIQNWVDGAVAAGKFDVITCEHSVNEIYVGQGWHHKLNTVVNIHSSVYRTCENQLETKTSEHELRDRLYLPLLYRYEQTLTRKFDHIVVTTDEDREQIQAFNSVPQVTVIPNGVDLAIFPYREADPGGHHLIFFGGLDYFANIDAACFFSLEVLPLLQAKYPHTTLSLVGSKPAPEVLALGERPGIMVTGRVPSIVEYLHQATVCVIPMRTGFGIKNKTLESMAAGTPVVGSDRGLEGIDVEDPLCALRANTVEEYVDAIARLFENAQLRETLSRHGRCKMEKEFTWSTAATRYEEVLSG